ncbi:MAG: hypothetical protein JOZ08_00855 [Verrucomicrobia bacterium]|nr:hypothetical protein [Verrucomicrobiota bacterium]MBV8277872.1 hypothetical protein [Verrucomicrobiota bacterium]
MKRFATFLALGSLVLSVLAATAHESQEKDYSIMTAKPYRLEIERGQQRLTKFLSHLNPKRRALLDQTPYVAVQVYVLNAGELPGLTFRLGKGSVPSNQFAQDIRSGANVQVKFLLIYDSRSQQLVGEDGVLVTDTPTLNTVGMFDGKHAVYIGTGW